MCHKKKLSKEQEQLFCKTPNSHVPETEFAMKTAFKIIKKKLNIDLQEFNLWKVLLLLLFIYLFYLMLIYKFGKLS